MSGFSNYNIMAFLSSDQSKIESYTTLYLYWERQSFFKTQKFLSLLPSPAPLPPRATWAATPAPSTSAPPASFLRLAVTGGLQQAKHARSRRRRGAFLAAARSREGDSACGRRLAGAWLRGGVLTRGGGGLRREARDPDAELGALLRAAVAVVAPVRARSGSSRDETPCCASWRGPCCVLRLGVVVVPSCVSADGRRIWQLVQRVGVGWRPLLPARDSSLAMQRAAAVRWWPSVAGAAALNLVVRRLRSGRWCVSGCGGSRDPAARVRLVSAGVGVGRQ